MATILESIYLWIGRWLMAIALELFWCAVEGTPLEQDLMLVEEMLGGG